MEEDDPFKAFADEMARAANVEAEAGLPLLNTGSAGLASSIPDLSTVSSVDEVAEIFLRAEAMRRSAAIQKKAVTAYLVALSQNKGQQEFDTSAHRVRVEREEQFSFDGDALQAECDLNGTEAPDFVRKRLTLTPGEIKALSPEQRAKLGHALRPKEDKFSVTIERK